MWLTALLDKLVLHGIHAYYHPPPPSAATDEEHAIQQSIRRRLDKAVPEIERYAQLVELRRREGA
jgi:hypothetical protein